MAVNDATPPRMNADDRRASIAVAAGRRFARDGYAGTRIDDVALDAGVTKPIVYRHFASKRALYLALLEQHEADLDGFLLPPTGAAGAVAAGAATTGAELRTILERWFDYVQAHSYGWVMLFRDASGDDEIRAVRERVKLHARGTLAGFISAQAGAWMPADEVEPTAELLRSGLAGVALWWIDHPDVPKATLVDVAARLTAAALTPPGG